MARKHISWYSKGLRDGAAFRHRVNRVETREAQTAMVREFFDAQDALMPRAQGCTGAADRQATELAA